MKRHALIATAAGLALLAAAPHAAAAAAKAAPLVPSPQPGTPDASPYTQISLLGPPPAQIKKVTVTGSKSGRHRGRLRQYVGRPGESFIPSAPFTPGEGVGVRVTRVIGNQTHHLAFHFTIATQGAPSLPPQAPPASNDALNTLVFQSRPDLHPVGVLVTQNDPGVAPGYEFVAPIRGPGPAGPMYGQYGPMIVDPHGSPVWFNPLAPGIEAFNFAPHTYHGVPVVAWWQGQLSPLGFGVGNFVIADDTYKTLGIVKAGNGLQADLHELVLTPAGTALMLVYDPVVLDLTPYGGAPNTTMFDSVVQEVDVKSGLVMYEWHALGNIDPTESYSPITAGVTWDPAHLNSIQETPDGNLLLSGRNTWAGYLVAKRTGKIIWRLGGKKSTFALAPGVQFAWQHDVQLHAGNIVSLFDDEAAPKVGAQSRGELIKIDTKANTAALAGQYAHSTAFLAGSQGNAEVLPNGNVFVGWGAVNFMTEFNGAGRQVFDAQFPSPIESYRAFRFPWAGHPTAPPDIGVMEANGGGVTVYASWNGATDVASWQVLAGPDPSSLTVAGSGPRSGFETAITVANMGPFFEVKALTANGRVIGQSKAIHL